MEVSCIILAGGKSSRLNNKPFLILDKKPLVMHVFDVVRKIFSEIVVVVKTESQKEELENILSKHSKKIKIVIDDEKVYSPIAGINEGVKHIKNKYFFVVASDMPFLKEKIIRELISRLYHRVECVVYAWSSDKFEPLCAVYRKDFFDGWSLHGSISQLIQNSENKVLIPIFKETNEFFNVNTKKDMKIARALL